MIFVLDFGFGQGGVVVNAPVDRLASAIDITLFHEVEKVAGDDGLVPVTHGEVRIAPAAEYAEALEVAFVLLDVAGGIFAAALAKLWRRNFAFAAEFLFHLGLDGQPVAIPTRDVGR